MKYNPDIHHRRSIRLRNYDYSQAGMYFVTICAQDRICRFGAIENEEMLLNDFGEIVYSEWEKLPKRYPSVALDAFQIMPNHIHGIIILENANAGAPLASAQNNAACTQNDATDTQNNAVFGNVIGAYKSLVANQCLEIYKMRNECMGKLWQRNYWEHIIRNDESYQNIANYIIGNPKNWQKDKFYEKEQGNWERLKE